MITAERKLSLPADPRPEWLCAVVDNAEQLPFDMSPMRSVVASLETGDYSILGLEHQICIERKSLPDLVGCCGTERNRFEKELQRMLAHPARCVVVEASWADLQAGAWRSKLTPQSATGSVLAWIGSGVPFLFAGSREAAQQATVRLLYSAARRRYRELRGMIQTMETSL